MNVHDQEHQVPGRSPTIMTWAGSALVFVSALVVGCGDSRDRGDETGDDLGIMPTVGDPNATPDLTDTDGQAEGGTGGGTGGIDGDPTDPGGKKRCEHIDFLFVIDDSSSMADEQAALRRSVPGFINAIRSELELETFNLGVISTGEVPGNAKGCRELGSMVVHSEAGVCGPYFHGNNYMTHGDDLDQSFVCAATLGVQGSSNERPMEATMQALLGGLDCNAGFVRDNALLVVTMISDEEDDHENRDGEIFGSPDGPEQWHQAVLDAKQGKTANAVALGLVGLDRPNACPTEDLQPGQGAENSPRMREFFARFGERGFTGDICETDYEPFFKRVLGVIKQACLDFDPPARHAPED